MPKTDQRPHSSDSTKPYNRSGNVHSGKKSNWNQKSLQPPTSLSACKKQVRDVSRLLNRKGLASTARVELERRLKALTIQQGQLTNSQKDKANASRYHKIKFFERKKVDRMLKQIDKKLEPKEIDSETREKLIAEKQDLLVNLNYTIYYPNEFKYISLFPADPSSTTEDTAEKRETIRLSVRKAMEKGELPKDPRDISVEERKAIRSGCRFMLRSVSNVHDKQVVSADSGAPSDDARASDAAATDEEDEFFA
ncbi:18S rRNA maturation protein [Coemansia guatemalensis]|uniref:rRNA-processing protein EFG1 n=1 Tax=Coemansia guatemalensis TaxID=2761395 RepID=A0A9W8LVS7_9FUNG|nr:18S rRNA maturation protein [Coemansia guatemalensis]